MDTSKLKKFAQFARRSLIEQVQSKLKLVLADESAARREQPKAVKDLEQKLNQFANKKEGEEQLIEQVAYTWFNRFCALRFMDVNQYNRIMVLSPISGQFQPEILAEAKAGHLDDAVFNDKAREKIQGLLSGSVPSRDGQAEAYRLMIVAVCNDYYRLMPFLFQRIEDYTELLMPDDLLSGNSILAYTREAMTPENCESVESIGWLYQFYISEKKDKVFEGLKKNIKIAPENIPAATQLFTPHWIVKYLVENSLGRLWMLNNPNSKVIEQMEYYIKPVEDETDYLKVSSPEELKICDPACGSGHMLTYAYDLLYAIYSSTGEYDDSQIPELILTKNLFGIEIDERAAELAAFALSMKALKGNPKDDSNNRRRFFRNPIKPNICRLEKVKIDEDALEEYMDFIGRNLFTQGVIKTLSEFEEADNFGSLIQPTLTNATDVLAIFEAKGEQVDMFLADTHKSVLKILKQADYLSSRYHALIANPPYMGSTGMNARLKAWSSKNYPDSKQDLFAMFIESSYQLAVDKGFIGMITIQNWMFLSSFERLRNKLLETVNINSLLQIGFNSFPELNSKFALASSFVLTKGGTRKSGCYFDLNSAPHSANKRLVFDDKYKNDEYYTVDQKMFSNIPGAPFAYWADENSLNCFKELPNIGSGAETRKGMVTAQNAKFVRQWFEVSLRKSALDKIISRTEAKNSGKKWFSYLKGGGYRKWYGNKLDVVNWEGDGAELQTEKHPIEKRVWATNFNLDYIFKPNINWGAVSLEFSARISLGGELFDAGGSACFTNDFSPYEILGFLNSNVSRHFLSMLNPSLNFQAGNISDLPVIQVSEKTEIDEIVKELVDLHKDDWNSSELSWDFRTNNLVSLKDLKSIKSIHEKNIALNTVIIDKVISNEEKLNLLLTSSYGLNNEVSIKVSSKEVTLFCNPLYRFGVNHSKNELSNLYRCEKVLEFISYSIGCLFGRFSIDEEGLILANKGDTLKGFLEKIPSPTFMPDEDNVIPIIDFDGDWFEDDITERFKALLKVTFGEEHFSENLVFIEAAIGKNIKKYLVKDFYADHVKRYNKRPIYWMFSSPKGSFNALIYMHRYQPDTASIVLNEYLREFRRKLIARKETNEHIEINPSASQKDITNAIKAIAKIDKVLEEVNDYEREVLYPLAGKNIEIDLDDGVKHNYPLFGKTLKKVTGLS
jgi:type II restriction/modification system DNA methylase subunit YeeA